MVVMVFWGELGIVVWFLYVVGEDEVDDLLLVICLWG